MQKSGFNQAMQFEVYHGMPEKQVWMKHLLAYQNKSVE